MRRLRSSAALISLNPPFAGHPWQTDNPVRFQKSQRMIIEHGHGHSRSHSYYTVAY
ncbi:MAG TPA: hypothetical protein VIJ79_10665 [Acidobacteriaceae bacterium]